MYGFNSIMLQDEVGNPDSVYSIASGLDYPSVEPEHAFFHDLQRIEYKTVNNQEALNAFFLLSKYEGIIPALESAHAFAYAIKKAKQNSTDSILVNFSGRDDKDIDYIVKIWNELY